MLRRIGPDDSGWMLGVSGAGLGDMDGDGRSEFAVSADRGVDIWSMRHGRVLATLADPASSRGFGRCLVPIGDLDGDLQGELAVMSSNVPDPSAVSIISPANGRLHYTWSHGQRADFFGRAIAPIGDADGDGVTDIAVGSGGGQDHAFLVFFEVTDSDFVRLYSGRTGEPLWTREGAEDDWFNFGESLAAIGDANGDGVPDVAVGELPNAYFTSTPSPSGRVWILSGRDGSTLNHIGSLEVTDPFGQELIGLGDLDLDGRVDLAISSNQNVLRYAQAKPGYVRVVSAIDGSTRYTVRGLADADEFGQSLAVLPDWNGDGAADFAVAAPQGNVLGDTSRTGYVRIVSGRDGATLAEVRGTYVFGQFGSFVADAGDVDGDCHPDLLVGESRFCKPGASVYVLSGRALLDQY